MFARTAQTVEGEARSGLSESRVNPGAKPVPRFAATSPSSVCVSAFTTTRPYPDLGAHRDNDARQDEVTKDFLKRHAASSRAAVPHEARIQGETKIKTTNAVDQ